MREHIAKIKMRKSHNPVHFESTSNEGDILYFIPKQQIVICMLVCHMVFLLTRVLVREGEGERGGVPEAVLLGADREAPLGLAEAHHVQRQREVLKSGDQIAMPSTTLEYTLQVQGVGMFPMFYLVVGRGISAEELRLLNARRVPTVHAGVVPAKIRITGTRHGKRCSHVRLS